ncbi:MAG: hypothetical protein J6W26_01610 [Bacteroidales bacterium]|nr:hypothetical protein [Bacteroidales bacterium]
MKKFVCQFGVRVIIVIVIAIAVDYVISAGLRKTDIRKYSTWNDIYKGGLDADLLVIGASNAWSGFNTYIMDSALHLNSYNLGFDGHNIDYYIVRYNTYRRFNAKPKVVLINTLFSGTLDVSAHPQYEREQFFPFVNDKELMSQVAEAKNLGWKERYLPLVRYFGYREEIENGVLAFFGKKDFLDGGMHKGFRGNDYAWDEETLSKDTLISISINTEAVLQLNSFSKQLIDDGIQVFFVKSPIYYPLRSKFENIEQTDSVFNAIANKYDITILDYYFSRISMDSAYFYNPGHLNIRGSEEFTLELCHDLDSIWNHLRLLAQ